MAAILPLRAPWSTLHLRLHRALVGQPDLLPRGARLLLAVSGGQDSLALTQLLLDLRRLHLWDLQLWHGNHGWNPAAAGWAESLCGWAETVDLPIQVSTAAPPPASEAEARAWRYHSLEQRAGELGCRHVVTGHTASDRAETVLLNLARGADRRGLSSLRRSRRLTDQIVLVRPLLDLTRAETARFCSEHGLPVLDDPSNAELRYSRNRIRHQVIPVLEDLHPGAVRRISAMAERFEQENNEELLPLALAYLLETGAGPSPCLRRSGLVTLTEASQRQLLRHWLEQETGQRPTAAQLEPLPVRLRPSSGPGSLDLAGGWRLQWDRIQIRLLKSVAPPGSVCTPSPPANLH